MFYFTIALRQHKHLPRLSLAVIEVRHPEDSGSEKQLVSYAAQPQRHRKKDPPRIATLLEERRCFSLQPPFPTWPPFTFSHFMPSHAHLFLAGPSRNLKPCVVFLSVSDLIVTPICPLDMHFLCEGSAHESHSNHVSLDRRAPYNEDLVVTNLYYKLF